METIYAVVAYIIEYYWVVQVAIAAAAVYTTFASYSAQQKAQKAAQREALAAQNRNAYRNFLNPLTPRRIPRRGDPVATWWASPPAPATTFASWGSRSSSRRCAEPGSIAAVAASQ